MIGPPNFRSMLAMNCTPRHGVQVMFSVVSVCPQATGPGSLPGRVQTSTLISLYRALTLPSPPDTFRVCCRILNSNESKECECIMEFPLKFFRPQKGLSGYCILQWQINIFMQHILIMKIVKNLSLVLFHYTFTMYRPRVYNISQW